MHDLPQNHCGDNQEGTLLLRFYIYFTHFVSVTFEHIVCRGSLMTSYITLLASLVEHSLVHWYQQFVTVHHVPKYMSCHKAIVVISGRAHCFHDYIYVTLILLLWDLSTMCVVDHLWPLIFLYIYTFIFCPW